MAKKVKRLTKKQLMRAYFRGLEAGQNGKPFVSPYTTGKLIDQWIHGYQIGSK